MFNMYVERITSVPPQCIALSADELETILYDPGDNGIVMGIFQALGDWGGLRFHVSGFGDDHWPGDVRTEMCIVLEQIPDITDWLLTRSLETSCRFDFFEQGVERFMMIGHLDPETLEIRCKPNAFWQPDPETEQIDRRTFIKMLLQLTRDFLEVAYPVSPAVLIEHPLFNKWLTRVSRLQLA